MNCELTFYKSKKTKKVYLDYNIIINLLDLLNKKKLTLEKIAKYRNKYSFRYSYGHMEEVNNYSGNKNKIIAFINYLTESKSLIPQNYFLLKEGEEHPKICLERIRNHENTNFQDELFLLSSKLDKVDNFFQEENIQKPKILNNMVGKEVFIKNKKVFLKFLYIQNEIQKVPIKNVIKKMQNGNFNIEKDLLENFEVREAIIGLMFRFLEKIRYYEEKDDKYRSKVFDVTHAICGISFDIFITQDKRFYKKIRAVYEMLEISTKIILMQ